MAVQVRQAQSFLEGGPRLGAGEWGTCMRKVIAYQGRAEEWRRRASEATNAQQREADERMVVVWELLARMRETQLKEGHYQAGLLVRAQMNECPRLGRGQSASYQEWRC